MKDLSIVTKDDYSKLICPTKLWRERGKWGKGLEKKHSSIQPPNGLYSDGKKCPTLTKDLNSVKVQVWGTQGRRGKKTIKTSCIKTYEIEHYTCVSEPGGKYLTHTTPADGTGQAIGKELADVVRERNIRLEVMGMDGTRINTGIHNGTFRVVEQELGIAIQHIVCLLHLNELPF